MPYYVVDASSSRFLLLDNRLDAGPARREPARQECLDAAVGQHAGAPRRSPPGPGASRLEATFADAIELVGADFPTEVRRPGKIPLDLIFRIKARAARSYKIFVHFDGPARRA